MKKKKILSLVGFLLLSILLHAQTELPKEQTTLLPIDGFITEADTTTAIDFVTVQLFSLPDSTFIKGAVTGNDGGFSLKTKPGQYFLKISSVGYRTQIHPFQLTATDTGKHFGKLPISSGATELKGAEVVATIPPVVQKGDTTTYNAAAFRVAEGSALEELIKKLPGAEVDDEGNLTINGQKITKVVMDGEEFFINDLNSAMKDLPADMIDKLQVYHKKSDKARATGIDDGNDDLVLDLRVKPDRKQGWNGNVMAGIRNQGQYEGRATANRFKNKMNFSLNASTDDDNITKSYRTSVNYSKRSDKVNFGANVNFNRSDSKRWYREDRETFITDSTSQYSHSDRNNQNTRNNFSASFRMEWRPDSLTTINFRPSVNYSKGNSRNNGSSWTKNNEMEEINNKKSVDRNENTNFSTRGSLYINRRFHKKGRNLSLNFDYSVNNGDGTSFSNSETWYAKFGDSIDVRNYKTNTSDRRHEISVRASYTEPLFKNHYLEANYQYSNRPSNYERYSYDWNDETGNFLAMPDSAQSRCTETVYNTQQGRLSLVANAERYRYTLGVNVEAQRYSTRNYFQQVTVTTQARTVVNYSPNANFWYRFNENSTIRMDYRGYSSQPSLNDLQPITDQTDPLNIRTGNPNLKPAFNNNVNANYQIGFPKKFMNLNVYAGYNNRMNSVAWITTYNEETGVKKNAPENVNGNWGANAGLNFNSPLDKKRMFSIDLSSRTNFRQNVSFTKVKDNQNSVENFAKTWDFYEQMRLRFHHKICDVNLQGSVNYSTSRNTLRKESNEHRTNYRIGGSFDITLPWDIRLSSDINSDIRRGSRNGYDRTTTMWNAQLSKSFFRKKNVVVRVNLYDILKERETIGYAVDENSIRDWSSNTSEKYFMASVTYRFNVFGAKKVKRNKAAQGRRR